MTQNKPHIIKTVYGYLAKFTLLPNGTSDDEYTQDREQAYVFKNSLLIERVCHDLQIMDAEAEEL